MRKGKGGPIATVGRLARLAAILDFAWRTQRALLSAAAIVAALLLVGMAFVAHRLQADAWQWVQNIATPVTLVVAFLIWLGEQGEDWQGSLAKRLTGHFLDKNGVEVMRCEQAYLAGEADLRAWAQQLGFQMDGHEQLSFLPKLDEVGPDVLWDDIEKRHFEHYEVSIHLRTLPRAVEAAMTLNPGDGPWVVWTPPDFRDPRYPAGAPAPMKGGVAP